MGIWVWDKGSIGASLHEPLEGGPQAPHLIWSPRFKVAS